ncbi:MAG: hypothetical protein KGH57_02795 [Candidatus Micrarchaeota archaeon]|nr:hypothetical protein [Candidatus Micrarchaeota archaeon]
MALRQMRSGSPKVEDGKQRIFLIGGASADVPREILEKIARDRRESKEVERGRNAPDGFRPGTD